MSDIPKRGYGSWEQFRRRFQERGEAEFHVNGPDADQLEGAWGTLHFPDYRQHSRATTIEKQARDIANG